MVVAGAGKMLPRYARQRARAILERATRGEAPEKARQAVMTVPTPGAVCEASMTAGEDRSVRTVRACRHDMNR